MKRTAVAVRFVFCVQSGNDRWYNVRVINNEGGMENQPTPTEGQPKTGKNHDWMILAGVIFIAVVVALVFVYRG